MTAACGTRKALGEQFIELLLAFRLRQEGGRAGGRGLHTTDRSAIRGVIAIASARDVPAARRHQHQTQQHNQRKQMTHGVRAFL